MYAVLRLTKVGRDRVSQGAEGETDIVSDVASFEPPRDNPLQHSATGLRALLLSLRDVCLRAQAAHPSAHGQLSENTLMMSYSAVGRPRMMIVFGNTTIISQIAGDLPVIVPTSGEAKWFYTPSVSVPDIVLSEMATHIVGATGEVPWDASWGSYQGNVFFTNRPPEQRGGFPRPRGSSPTARSASGGRRDGSPRRRDGSPRRRDGSPRRR